MLRAQLCSYGERIAELKIGGDLTKVDDLAMHKLANVESSYWGLLLKLKEPSTTASLVRVWLIFTTIYNNPTLPNIPC